jgi:hypothetical protein
LVVNFKTNYLVYEIEGNMKEFRFTNKAEAGLEPQENKATVSLEQLIMTSRRP